MLVGWSLLLPASLALKVAYPTSLPFYPLNLRRAFLSFPLILLLKSRMSAMVTKEGMESPGKIGWVCCLSGSLPQSSHNCCWCPWLQEQDKRHSKRGCWRGKHRLQRRRCTILIVFPTGFLSQPKPKTIKLFFGPGLPNCSPPKMVQQNFWDTM